MKKGFLSALLFICGITAQAQQIPLYSQYYINPFVYNPSFTGISGKTSAYFIAHNQWSGFANAPVTYALTFDTPVQRDKIGLGFTLSSDRAGYLTRNEAMLSMSYRARITGDQSVIFGLAGGLINNQIDFTRLSVPDPTEASIYGQSEGITAPNANFGISYHLSRLEVGVSVPQLLAPKLTYSNQMDERIYYSLVRHYLGSIKYTFDISPEKGITAYPIVLVHAADANIPVQTEASAVIRWERAGWFGASYRTNSSMAFNLGVLYKGLSIGYAYEIPTTGIASFVGNSSELLVGYTFGQTQKAAERDKKLDLVLKKLDNLENQSRKVRSKLDSLEEQVKTTLFEQVDGLKRELKEGDILTLKNVNFEYKSTQLTERSYDILEQLLKLLENNPTMKIAIYGHSDDIGSDEYNDQLSQQRAKVVQDYLIEAGIDPKRLSYKGFGKRKPLVQGTKERARAKNRRVEFEVISK
jgi:type IX secretion system PorP/SprF family membrane protein